MTDLNHVNRAPGWGCTYLKEHTSETQRQAVRLRFLSPAQELTEASGSERPLVIFLPFESSSAWVSAAAPEQSPVMLDHTSFACFWSPVGNGVDAKWTIRPARGVLKIAVIAFGRDVLREAQLAYGLPEGNWAPGVAVFPKTSWIHEILHRYLFECVVAQTPETLAARFLEQEITKEVHYQFVRRGALSAEIPQLHDLPKALQKALIAVEQQLLSEWTLAELSGRAGVSGSTLTRLFRTHLSCTPVKFIWRRRLQAARAYLGTGRFGVEEVAFMVGYGDAASFSRAYIQLFGVQPSADRLHT